MRSFAKRMPYFKEESLSVFCEKKARQLSDAKLSSGLDKSLQKSVQKASEEETKRDAQLPKKRESTCQKQYNGFKTVIQISFNIFVYNFKVKN